MGQAFQVSCTFSGMPWYWQVVQQCSLLASSGLDESMICGRKYTMQQPAQYIENNNQPGDKLFSLDVVHYLRKTLRFRVPTVQPQEVISTAPYKSCTAILKQSTAS